MYSMFNEAFRYSMIQMQQQRLLILTNTNQSFVVAQKQTRINKIGEKLKWKMIKNRKDEKIKKDIKRFEKN